MTEQGFDCAYSTIKEMTDFFETRVENLELRKDKKKSSASYKKKREKKYNKKTNWDDSKSSVVEFNEEILVEHRPIEKYCTIYWKCSHGTDKCKNLKTLKNKQKKYSKSIKPYPQGKRDLNALIEKKFKKFVKYKRRKSTEKEF